MNKSLLDMTLEKKIKRLKQEDYLLNFIVETSTAWGIMSDSEFEEFWEQLYTLIINFVMKEKGAAQ